MKIAIFDLTDCEGCELQFITLKEKLLDFFQDYEIVNWRLLQEEEKAKYFDIAIVTGTPVKPEEREFLRLIRSRSKYLVALGYCATNGGIQGWVRPADRKKLTDYVYKKGYKPRATEAQPLSFYVKVDKEIPGCPVLPDALEDFIKEIPKLSKPTHPPKVKSPCRFLPDYITKIEGHGTLKVSLKKAKAQLEVDEGERLIEGILLGRDFKEAPWITSRICGICPVAHNLTSLKALENALNIKPNEVIVSLRKVLLYSQIIHSHIFHLFFLSLPDFLGEESGIKLAKVCPAEFHLVLNLKRISEKISEIIGGQVIHPTNTTFGGFNKLPQKHQLSYLLEEAKQVMDEAEDLVKLFSKIHYPKIFRESEYLAMEDYYEGKIISNKAQSFWPNNYKKEIKEEIIPHSTAKIGRRSETGLMVGALARLNLKITSLNPRAKKVLSQAKIDFPNFNPFLNNLAQAIEVLHLLEETVKELTHLTLLKDSLYQKAGEKPRFEIKAKEGVGALEAPRGTLYHFYQIDNSGKIKNADILTPTVQNLSNIEKDANVLLSQIKNYPKEKKIKLLKMLIRAYDPCITCSVH